MARLGRGQNIQPQSKHGRPVAAPSATGRPKYYNGSTFQQKPLKYFNGSIWQEKPVKEWTGSAWEILT